MNNVTKQILTFNNTYQLKDENKKLKLLLTQCYEYILKQEDTEEAISLRADLVDQL